MRKVLKFGCSTINKLESELNKLEKVAFKDRYLAFQREWNEFKNKAKETPPRVFNDKLDTIQQKKINLLVKHIEYLNENEFQYLNHILQQQVLNKPEFDVHSLGMEDATDVGVGLWPTVHPQWIQQQETMAKLWPLGQQGVAALFSEVVGFGGGVATGANAQTQQAAPVQEEKEEVKEAPKETQKVAYDVILEAIDAAQKIKIIKEVRAIFNLGLKDAKDQVEKLPATLSKQMKAKEAEELQAKLQAIGCTIKLA